MKEKIRQLIRYHHIKRLYEKYERVLMPATLVFGVAADSITFTSINIWLSFILLGAYFFIAGGAIIYIHAYDARHIPERNRMRYLRLVAPLIIQFTFGALLSGSFVFYLFSGSIFVSWPFIGVLAALMVSNDVFRKYYLRPVVQIGVYYFILFSVVSIILPFWLEDISAGIFVGGGLASLIIIFVYCRLAARVAPEIKSRRRSVAFTVFFIFAFLNGLYFINAIPPLPLSLREAIVSHGLQRKGGSYILQVENEKFSDRLTPGVTMHKVAGERIAVYTAIFAPGKLKTRIVHHWQSYNEKLGEWETRDRLPFQIFGGRSDGFRGYSIKSAVEAGEWRVDVETERGQVLGRVGFWVEEVSAIPEFATEIR